VAAVSLDFFELFAIYFSFGSAKPYPQEAALASGNRFGRMGMRFFIFRWAITTVAVMVAASFISGIRYDSAGSLIGAALLLGILNAFLRPVLLLLAAPLIILTLGLFIFVVNGLMLLLVHQFVHGFHVDSFGSAFWGAILVSLVSWILSAFFRGSDGRVHPITHHTEMRRVTGRVVGSSKPGEL
jgi:putative membrane protein